MYESGTSRDAIKAAMLTAAAGLLTTLITLLVGWLQERGSASRRLKATEEALKRVQFWEAWHRMRTVIAPGESQGTNDIVASELSLLMQSLKSGESVETEVVHRRREEEHDYAVSRFGRFRRWFLLYKPLRWFAWIPRFYFYMWVLGACGTFIAGLVFLAMAIARQDTLELRGQSFGMSAGYALAAVFFRWLAVVVDRPRLSLKPRLDSVSTLK